MTIVWVGGKIWTDFFSKKFEWYPGTSIPNHDMVKLCVRSEYRGNSRMNTKANVEIIVYFSDGGLSIYEFYFSQNVDREDHRVCGGSLSIYLTWVFFDLSNLGLVRSTPLDLLNLGIRRSIYLGSFSIYLTWIYFDLSISGLVRST